MRNTPIATVVISGLNAEKFISEAIESVLNQTLQNFELVLIDDGSTDSTLSIYNDYKKLDNRIIIDSHENVGMGESVNRAVKFVNSGLIARMDADDIMIENRLEEQVNFMSKHHEIGIVGCLTEFIGNKSQTLGVQDFTQTNDLLTIEDTRRYVSQKKCIHFAHTGMMCRINAFMDVGGYAGKYWPSDDIELFNKIADKGFGVVVLPKVLMKYRLHESSIMASEFYKSVIKSHWVEDSILRRRKGMEELTYEAYVRKLDSESLLKRIRRHRVIYGNNYFRNAGIEFSNKNNLKFIYLTLLSLILRPNNISKRLFNKIKSMVKKYNT